MFFACDTALYRQSFATEKGVRAALVRIKSPLESEWYLANNSTEQKAIFQYQADVQNGQG